MRILFCTLILFVFAITAYVYSVIQIDETSYSKLANRLQNQHAEEMRKKGYSVESMGGEFCTDVQSIYIGLHAKKQLTIDELRPLYVEGVERFLNLINNDEPIRPYLHDYPFSIHNLSYSMSFPWLPVEASGMGPIVFVFCCKGNIIYDVFDPSRIDTNQLRTVHKEPYSEALRIVREAGLLPPVNPAHVTQ